jgi:hypothetical protein
MKRIPDRIEKIRSTLTAKGAEYATVNNRFHNFDDMAWLISVTPENALIGLMAKHWVSVRDIIARVEHIDYPTIGVHNQTMFTITPELVSEKFGDLINYLILLTGIRCRRSFPFEDIVEACISGVLDFPKTEFQISVKSLDDSIHGAIHNHRRRAMAVKAISHLIFLEERVLSLC